LKEGCTEVTILDHPEHIAPSQDVSNFFRVDYTDTERMQLVMKSEEIWRNDPIFKPFLRRIGRLVAYSLAHISHSSRDSPQPTVPFGLLIIPSHTTTTYQRHPPPPTPYVAVALAATEVELKVERNRMHMQ